MAKEKSETGDAVESGNTEPPVAATQMNGGTSPEAGNGYAVEGGSTPVGGGDDPFDLDNISVSGTSAEDLGIEKPILHIPVDKPGRQDFFRVHPDPEFRMDARIIKLDAERESYLVTRSIWPAIPGETKLVKLVPCLTRAGTLYMWPLPMPDELMGRRDTAWGTTARKAAEMAETKWVRMQANMPAGHYDVVSSANRPCARDIGIITMLVSIEFVAIATSSLNQCVVLTSSAATPAGQRLTNIGDMSERTDGITTVVIFTTENARGLPPSSAKNWPLEVVGMDDVRARLKRVLPKAAATMARSIAGGNRRGRHLLVKAYGEAETARMIAEAKAQLAKEEADAKKD
ncbi:hypothetical protein [Ruegeria sp. HKCCA5763]|uniref:hypothetical protein n=2 Tax=unclassified Ruegeria TaxID=2625375 RepID=UPI001489DBBB|nr:hypothetical protein [Ruegeria sp. HKCCA5763]